MNFVYAATLKKRFTCYGHFYLWQPVLQDQTFPCRSLLEIVDSTIEVERLSESKPDCVVIMMNPGSSHPFDASYIPETIEFPEKPFIAHTSLTPTQPDNTQYQIMRIALVKNWHHVRVLNLSDLRDPKSVSFMQRVEVLAETMGGTMHSLFCEERTLERNHLLSRAAGAPILLGWGQARGLLPLARRCMEELKKEKTYTVLSAVDPLLNAHPSPMMQSKKELWLKQMLDALDDVR